MKTIYRNVWEWMTFCLLVIFSFTFMGCSDEDKEEFRMPDENEILTESILIEESDDYVKYIDHELWGKEISFNNDTVTINNYIEREDVWKVEIQSKEYSSFYGDIKTFYMKDVDKKMIQKYCDEQTPLLVSGNYRYCFTFVSEPRMIALTYTVWDLSKAELTPVNY